MTLLFRVLHAAHARSTHHRLALDAVSRLGCTQAEGWQRLFLKHANELMLGAKAPDDDFKDFTNHVLHPRDDWWGGAPAKARSWYDHLVEALAKEDWALAAYIGGVLSHYLSDPLQPFHTGQTEAENNIHRAFEWSVANAYDALAKLADPAKQPKLVRSEGASWLEQLVTDGAREANGHYEKLMAHFDIHRAVVDPASGIDVVAKRIIANQLDRAIGLVAFAFDEAITEARVEPPQVALGLDTVLALIQVPARRWANRLQNVEERRLVERIYDELKATGTVERNLPEDERAVRSAFAAEVLAKRQAAGTSPQFAPEPRDAVETTVERQERRRRLASRSIPAPAAKAAPRELDRSMPEQLSAEPPRAAPVAADQVAPLEPLQRVTSMKLPFPRATTPAALEMAAPVAASPETAAIQQPALRVVARSRPDVAPNGPRFYLTGAAPIVDAPSIGPKMAERLIPLGLTTVDDLLSARPEMIATALDIKAIDTETVRDWQDQAELVCRIPGLRGTHAQLLVGAGFRTAEALSDAEPDVLCARVLAFAASPDGHRVLRNGDPPDIEKIKSWLANAQAVRAA